LSDGLLPNYVLEAAVSRHGRFLVESYLYSMGIHCSSTPLLAER